MKALEQRSFQSHYDEDVYNMIGLPGKIESSGIVGQRVLRFRLSFGLSQRELARRARISQPRVSQIETGQTAGPLPLRTLCDLADGLGVSLRDLIADDPLYELLESADDRAAQSRSAALPQSTGPLIGRADDTAAIVDAVRRGTRLLTLVGPGGVGKTQLALHAAGMLDRDFPYGIIFASLASCTDLGCVVSTIARGAGLRERDSRPLRSRLLSDLPTGPRPSPPRQC